MEYWGLILNSFVVFIHPSGLSGWKFKGPASTRDPLYFQPYEYMVNGTDPAHGSDEFQSMMKQRGSFFVERGDIASVIFDPTSKWGMGPIPHSGKVHVRTTSGKSREFILLGRQDGQAVRAAILSGSPIEAQQR